MWGPQGWSFYEVGISSAGRWGPQPCLITSSSPVPSPRLIFLSCNDRHAGSCIVEGESGFCDGGRLSTTPQVFMFSLAAISKESLCSANPRSPLCSGLRSCPPALKGGMSQTLPCGSFCIPCTPVSLVL